MLAAASASHAAEEGPRVGRLSIESGLREVEARVLQGGQGLWQEGRNVCGLF
jgi:hypothetical protein